MQRLISVDYSKKDGILAYTVSDKATEEGTGMKYSKVVEVNYMKNIKKNKEAKQKAKALMNKFKCDQLIYCDDKEELKIGVN